MSGHVRVTAGDLKNRRLAVNRGARPTSEKARAALFDIFGSWIEGRRVLELYAGSGAVAIEALSRGAASAVAVDSDASALIENRRSLSLDFEILNLPAETAIARLAREGRRFDLIFLDPPYGRGPGASLVSGLSVLLSGEGLVVWQTDSPGLPDAGPDLSVERIARYGRNVLSFLKRPSA